MEKKIKTADPTLKWRVQLQEAADAWDEHQHARRHLEVIAKKPKLINTTAATLIYIKIPKAMKDIGKPTETKHTKGSVHFTHKSNITCSDNNCKWDNTTEKTGNHCKPKDDAEQTKQGTKGTLATNTEGKKCSEKKSEVECKFPDCQWEGTERTDYSIIINSNIFSYCCCSCEFDNMLGILAPFYKQLCN
uniref:Variant surface glycoprotein n=1 Tax=Trypanosoma brucei TaxID=5691 RepID=A0A1V0FYM3_9TRYP|nr:variant surface glycoprotein [Trypanosoma brucei]